MKIKFDHIEIHVNNPSEYCEFLNLLFQGGRYKEIASGIYMFKFDNYNFEIKPSNDKNSTFGFQLPCLRSKNAKTHLTEIGIKIDATITNPLGNCYFFSDPEGLKWHIKEYDEEDEYINF